MESVYNIFKNLILNVRENNKVILVKYLFRSRYPRVPTTAVVIGVDSS